MGHSQHFMRREQSQLCKMKAFWRLVPSILLYSTLKMVKIVSYRVCVLPQLLRKQKHEKQVFWESWG